MTEIAVRPDRAPMLSAAAVGQDAAIARLADWAHAADAAFQMATKLVSTQFVPAHYRGKPAEATAAILAGAEVGLSPMAALRAFDNIQGTPAPKAITLRAIVQAQGHDVRVDESTDRVARVSVRRKGSDDWQTSTWTIEKAILAKYPEKNPNWKTNPTAMLIARATSEACKWVASDAIMGMPYCVEELQDQGYTGDTARRVTPGDIMGPQPPQQAQSDVVDAEAVSAPPAEPEPMTTNQRGRMFALFAEKGVIGADNQRLFVAKVLDRSVESRGALSQTDAAQVIEALKALPMTGPDVDETGGADLSDPVVDGGES